MPYAIVAARPPRRRRDPHVSRASCCNKQPPPHLSLSGVFSGRPTIDESNPIQSNPTQSNPQWTTASVVALATSCTLGVAMSYFAFKCRAAISATTFTVVGNCCKIATVIINVTIWDNHAKCARATQLPRLALPRPCLLFTFRFKFLQNTTPNLQAKS